MFRAVRVLTFTSFLNSHILAPKLPQKHFQGYLVIAYNFKGLFLRPFMNVGIKILIGGQMGAIFTLFCVYCKKWHKNDPKLNTKIFGYCYGSK